MSSAVVPIDAPHALLEARGRPRGMRQPGSCSRTWRGWGRTWGSSWHTTTLANTPTPAPAPALALAVARAPSFRQARRKPPNAAPKQAPGL